MANRFILNETSYFGAGARENLVPELTGRGLKKVMFVTDKVLLECGVATKVTAELDKAGIAYEIYSDVKANPTVANVQTGVAKFKEMGADSLVAVGGGSVMDTTKAVGLRALQTQRTRAFRLLHFPQHRVQRQRLLSTTLSQTKQTRRRWFA